ncbi:MAG: histidinol-phosphate transaminase [Desulfobacteraceae bacterium 4572_35.1]|nr:MAG: histidinol-phosphate transaminase [Desulfobacteraceae bacterium 4572_35.1]
MIPLRKNIAEMAGYVPGFQPKNPQEWIKLNTNENPYPPSPQVIEAIMREIGSDGEILRQYPDAASKDARQAAADLYGFDADWLIMANGSDELLNNLIRAFANEGDEVAYVEPSYSYYSTLIEIQGAKSHTFTLDDQYKLAGFPERYNGKLFFLTSPNAPLGCAFSLDDIDDLAHRCNGMLVVDEAYADFAAENALSLVKKHENLVVTRTFSKSYALAGMRLGLAVAHPQVIAALDKIRDHYHLDRLALVAAEAALRDQKYLKQRVGEICATRDWFTGQLIALGYSVIPSQTNFVFASPADGDGQRVYELLKQHKILVRYFSDPQLSHALRISIGSREQMDAVLEVLERNC